MRYTEVLLPFGKVIHQIKEMGISTDSQLLFDAISSDQLKIESALELGSGNGIISIMLSESNPSWTIIGIDIQPELIQLARANAKSCALEIDFIVADLKDYNSEKVDLILANPPYYELGKHRVSPIESRAIARHEIMCNMSDLLYCVKRNLKNGGFAYLIYPSNRLEQLENNLKKVDLKLIERKIINKIEKVIVKLSHNN